MGRQVSTLPRPRVSTRADSFYHNVRGRAILAIREQRRVEIKLGRKYPSIFFLCRDLLLERNQRPLREEAVFQRGVDLILEALTVDENESGGPFDFQSLQATCRTDESGKVAALYVKPRKK